MKTPSRRKALPALLATLAVALLLISCIFAPMLLFHQVDKATFGQPVPLPRAGGRLSPEAQYIYLVRAMEDRTAAQQAGTLETGNAYLYPATEARQDLAGLADAGAIPAALFTQAEGWLAASGVQCTATADNCGFLRIYCDFSSIGPFAISYEKEASTGLITRCWATGTLPAPDDGATGTETPLPERERLDYSAQLNAYLAYTSLSVVEDWQPAGYYNAALRSPGRGLLAYHDGGFTFGLAVEGPG